MDLVAVGRRSTTQEVERRPEGPPQGTALPHPHLLAMFLACSGFAFAPEQSYEIGRTRVMAFIGTDRFSLRVARRRRGFATALRRVSF